MKYKMLVLDMDGTLLTDDKKISDRNKEALDKAADLGVRVVVSTGRLFVSARVFGELIGVKSPIIASNGAYIREKDKDEVVYSFPLGEKNIREMLKHTKKYGLYCHLISWNTIFTEKLVYTAFNYSKWNKSLPEDSQVQINIVKDNEWDDIISRYERDILKAIVVDEGADRIKTLREDLKGFDMEIVSSYSNSIEVMNKGVSKGKAVEMLAKYYGIKSEEIICMGDEENDVSMINYAGLGIAMANGSEVIKSAADFITLSNQEDGVAYAIEKFILNTAK